MHCLIGLRSPPRLFCEGIAMRIYILCKEELKYMYMLFKNGVHVPGVPTLHHSSSRVGYWYNHFLTVVPFKLP